MTKNYNTAMTILINAHYYQVLPQVLPLPVFIQCPVILKHCSECTTVLQGQVKRYVKQKQNLVAQVAI